MLASSPFRVPCCCFVLCIFGGVYCTPSGRFNIGLSCCLWVPVSVQAGRYNLYRGTNNIVLVYPPQSTWPALLLCQMMNSALVWCLSRSVGTSCWVRECVVLIPYFVPEVPAENSSCCQQPNFVEILCIWSDIISLFTNMEFWVVLANTCTHQNTAELIFALKMIFLILSYKLSKKGFKLWQVVTILQQLMPTVTASYYWRLMEITENYLDWTCDIDYATDYFFYSSNS